MPYKSYTPEDFALDQDFRDWVLCPKKETNRYWKNWIANNPEKSEIIQAAIILIKALPVEEHKLTSDEFSKIIKNIESAIDSPKGRQKIIPINPYAKALEEGRVKRTSKIFRATKIAASFLIVASLSYIIYGEIQLHTTNTKEVIAKIELITKENPKGQKSTIYLNDGSKVFLNAESKIIFPKSFDQTQRTVELFGEAFFEIAQDKKRPFRVKTGSITTTAIGTSFNIRAFTKEQIKVSLATGKIQIDEGLDTDSAPNTHSLKPGEELSYSQISGYTKTLFDKNEVLAWKDGIIFFKGADANTVITKLERWYGVDITTAKESRRKWDISATFDNQSLKNVLESLSYSEKFEYSINEKNVLIKY